MHFIQTTPTITSTRLLGQTGKDFLTVEQAVVMSTRAYSFSYIALCDDSVRPMLLLNYLIPPPPPPPPAQFLCLYISIQLIFSDR